MKFFSHWSFDLPSAVMALLIAPLVIYFLGILKRFAKEWGGYALEGLMYWFGRAVHIKLASRLTLKRYCRLRLGEENRYLYVPSSLDIKLEVDHAFVPLTVEHHGSDKATYAHSELLALGNRVRIIGDPGSGKSSLVKRLFRDTCFAALSDPKTAKLPILLELKHLDVPEKKSVKELGTWLFQKLRFDASKSNVYRMQECFDVYAQDFGLLVLLDGLDEVSSTSYPRVQKAIEGLSRVLSQQSEANFIVITMRTQFHQQIREAFRDSFGLAVFLRPFSPTDVYEFLSRWPFGVNAHHQVARIYKELTDRPSLREMCGNPLVLAMYVAEDQAKGHLTTPASRTEFYQKVTEELILKRRLQQTGPAPAHTKLQEQRERILGRLAFDHMLNSVEPANSLEWASAVKVVQDVMKCDEAQAGSIFREIAKETGLVSEERIGETFRFIHLTFCEFLAAFEGVQGQPSGWKMLTETHLKFRRDPRVQLRARLIEVIPFACGLMPRVARKDALDDLSALGDNGLLARSLLETKMYEHQCWPGLVERQRSALLAVPEQQWGEQWLRDLHLFNVVVRDATQCIPHVGGIDDRADFDEFFRTLLNQQRESLSTLLHAYAAQDAAAAFRVAEISKLDLAAHFPDVILSHCDQAPFLALVIEHALRDKKRATLWATLLAESALRSRAVAFNLSRLDPMGEWEEHVTPIPYNERWVGSMYIAQTLLTQCLTIGLGAAKRTSFPWAQQVLLLGKVPAPCKFRGTALASRVAIVIVFLTLAAATVFSFPGLLKIGWIVLPFGIAFFCSYWVMLRHVTLKAIYRQVLDTGSVAVSASVVSSPIVNTIYEYGITIGSANSYLRVFSGALRQCILGPKVAADFEQFMAARAIGIEPLGNLSVGAAQQVVNRK